MNPSRRAERSPQPERRGYHSLLSQSQGSYIHDAAPFSGVKHAPSVLSHSATSMGSPANRFMFQTRQIEEQEQHGAPLAFSKKTATQNWGGSEGIS